MGLLSALTKAGIAKKVIDEGRKPQNQQRIKDLVSKTRRRGGRPAR